MNENPKDLIARMQLEAPESVVTLLDAAHEKITALQSSRELRPEIVRQKLDEIRAETIVQAEAEEHRLIEAVEKKSALEVHKIRNAHKTKPAIGEWDTQGEATKKLLSETHAARRATEILTDVHLIGQLTNADAIRELVEGWKLRENEGIVPVALAAEARLTRLHAVAARSTTTGQPNPVAPALSVVRDSLHAWRKANPSPLELIKQASSKGAREAAQIRDKVTASLRAYGLHARRADATGTVNRHEWVGVGA